MMGHRQTRIRYSRLFNYRNRVFWCLVISLIAYNEWIVYWSVGAATDFDTDKEAVRILVVADPQILGERYEPPSTRFFTHWDGDRYLQQGFKRAVAVSKPHIVVYLGDLADEGSIANEYEYSRYRQRFADIFRISPDTKEIFLPGDNDIGGEGYDRITPNKTERFARYFQRAAVVSHSLVDIIPVNRLAWHAEYLPYKMSEKRIRILASHIPVLPIYGQFAADAVKRYQPHLILSAHTHEANCFHVQLEPSYKITVDNLSPDAPPLKDIILPDIENNPAESLTEFAIPTCSYRMGVRRMGYGVVQIDEKKMTAKLAVLWLPERFPALRLYLLVVFICFLFALCKCCFYLWSGRVFKLVNAAKFCK